MAVPFDSRRMEVRGDPVPVVESVRQSPASGVAHFDISNTGTLAYIPGGTETVERTLVWVDRNGNETQVPAVPSSYQNPRISPDGKRVAIGTQELGGQIWIYDLARETRTRLTFQAPGQPAGNINPFWTPDGKRIVFQSRRTSKANLFWQAADGSGEAEQLATSEYTQSPSSWSPDGKTLLFMQVNPQTSQDLWVMHMTDRKTEPLLLTPVSEAAGRISPDSRWMVYMSDESGRREIYVRSFPGPGGKWQISSDGGQEPVWNPSGREIYYRNGNKMMAVNMETGSGFSASKPRVLFEGPYQLAQLTGAQYDVSPDGQRFLMLKPVESKAGAPTQINVVLNWFEELKAKVPVGK